MGAMHAAPAVIAALTIVVSPGNGNPSKHWTLRCGPAGGTLPHAPRACTRLAALDDPFAPVPKNEACTQIFGGPQTARITGRIRGRSVWATFNLRNGCQIARWRRLSFLLQP